MEWSEILKITAEEVYEKTNQIQKEENDLMERRSKGESKIQEGYMGKIRNYSD